MEQLETLTPEPLEEADSSDTAGVTQESQGNNTQ